MGMSLAYAQRRTYIGTDAHLYAHEAEADVAEADEAHEADEAAQAAEAEAEAEADQAVIFELTLSVRPLLGQGRHTENPPAVNNS